ncbi:YiaA/YiaB family inner membrane protein [Myxosarcina sp. GI1]|uniref:YiaA/YiaB family inner membrane protein n=1 Tax=Myxosarcina sp. GI1 TaxID=1541065 RepID=UPI0005647A19|nr:YiaA/YiaB family inner membrane protein [Myxosarcina sp. GI1]
MAKKRTQEHSSAWVIQTWLSFMISISATAIGIIYLPVNGWVKGYMGMGLVFTIGSTISLTKTQRDLYEAEKLTHKVEEARVERILNEHDNYK